MRTLRWAGIYVTCLAVVLVVRLGLWVLRYQQVHSRLVRPCPPDPQPGRRATVARITRTVARISRIVPDASCLTRTIAAQSVLSWKGIPTTVAIGLRNTSQDGFGAHAWLTWNGQIVMEGDESSVEEFARVLDLPTPLPASP
jgi:hypothetical protein